MLHFSMTVMAVRVILFISIVMTTVESSRSLIDIIGNSMEQLNVTVQQQSPNTNWVEDNVINHETLSRIEREASTDSCPFHPHRPVILNNRETYLPFDLNEPRPDYYPTENRTLEISRWEIPDWWPGDEFNLQTICPWRYFSQDMWKNNETREYNFYPRYIKAARCLCSSCLISNFTCERLKQKFTFYEKTTNCDGTLPIFQEIQEDITVGCVCANKVQIANTHMV